MSENTLTRTWSVGYAPSNEIPMAASSVPRVPYDVMYYSSLYPSELEIRPYYEMSPNYEMSPDYVRHDLPTDIVKLINNSHRIDASIKKANVKKAKARLKAKVKAKNTKKPKN
jgi:hypothetical protein